MIRYCAYGFFGQLEYAKPRLAMAVLGALWRSTALNTHGCIRILCLNRLLYLLLVVTAPTPFLYASLPHNSFEKIPRWSVNMRFRPPALDSRW